MDKIEAWSAAIMCASVLCIGVKFIVPEGQKKIIGFVLGLFMLTVIIEPFGTLISAVKNFDIRDFTTGENTVQSEEMTSFCDELTAQKGCELLKEQIEEMLDGFGVSEAQVEVLYSVSPQDRVITVQGARIQLSKGQAHRKVQIEKYIKEQTGLTTWVYIKGESENEGI